MAELSFAWGKLIEVCGGKKIEGLHLLQIFNLILELCCLRNLPTFFHLQLPFFLGRSLR